MASNLCKNPSPLHKGEHAHQRVESCGKGADRHSFYKYRESPFFMQKEAKKTIRLSSVQLGIQHCNMSNHSNQRSTSQGSWVQAQRHYNLWWKGCHNRRSVYIFESRDLLKITKFMGSQNRQIWRLPMAVLCLLATMTRGLHLLFKSSSLFSQVSLYQPWKALLVAPHKAAVWASALFASFQVLESPVATVAKARSSASAPSWRRHEQSDRVCQGARSSAASWWYLCRTLGVINTLNTLALDRTSMNGSQPQPMELQRKRCLASSFELQPSNVLRHDERSS